MLLPSKRIARCVSILRRVLCCVACGEFRVLRYSAREAPNPSASRAGRLLGRSPRRRVWPQAVRKDRDSLSSSACSPRASRIAAEARGERETRGAAARRRHRGGAGRATPPHGVAAAVRTAAARAAAPLPLGAARGAYRYGPGRYHTARASASSYLAAVKL